MRTGVGVGATSRLVWGRSGVAAPSFVASTYGTVERELRADMGVTLNATKVSAVADQSGAGRHATQATAANQPLYVASDANFAGKPSFSFQGAGSPNNQFFDFASFGALAGADIFCVLRASEDPSVATAGDISGLTTDGGAPREVYPFSDGNIYLGWGSTARKTVGNPAAPLTTTHVLHVRSRASDWALKINGTSVFSTATNTVAWPASPRFGSALADLPWLGQFAHFVVYSTLTDEAGALAALKTLYGVA